MRQDRTGRRIVAVAAMLVALAFLPGGLGRVRAGEGSAKGQTETAGKSAPSDAGRKSDAGVPTAEKPPACMHCGATCGLEPVCVCKPGTKKKPVTEYETTCEPFCVPGCSGPPWCRHGGGCTDCPDACTHCAGTVRFRRKLSKETRDEEVATVKRTVAYVCCRCDARPPEGCCAAGLAAWPPLRAAWWTAWWPWGLK